MGAMLRSLASKKDISGSGERHVKWKMKDIGTTDRLKTHKRNDEQADTNREQRQTSFDFYMCIYLKPIIRQELEETQDVSARMD